MTTIHPHDVLTPREIELLALLAAGLSNPRIAATLRLSINTIERHCSNIYAKLGVLNRTQAAIYFHRTSGTIKV